jgi:hypothetical protein
VGAHQCGQVLVPGAHLRSHGVGRRTWERIPPEPSSSARCHRRSGLFGFMAAAMWSGRAGGGLASAIHAARGSLCVAVGLLWFLAVTGLAGIPSARTAIPGLAFWFIGLAGLSGPCRLPRSARRWGGSSYRSGSPAPDSRASGGDAPRALRRPMPGLFGRTEANMVTSCLGALGAGWLAIGLAILVRSQALRRAARDGVAAWRAAGWPVVLVAIAAATCALMPGTAVAAGAASPEPPAGAVAAVGGKGRPAVVGYRDFLAAADAHTIRTALRPTAGWWAPTAPGGSPPRGSPSLSRAPSTPGARGRARRPRASLTCPPGSARTASGWSARSRSTSCHCLRAFSAPSW